jgi:putative MATE family efflux protein
MKSSIVSSSGTLRPLLRLALPVLAEELLNLLVGYTDWWLTGNYLEGAAYQAAMGLLAYLLWLAPSLFAAVAIGATALVARKVGAGDAMSARRVAHQALLVGSVIALIATLAATYGGLPFIRLLKLPDEATPLAWEYLRWVLPAIPAIMLEQVAIAILRGAGDTVTGLMAKVVVNIVNTTLSAVLLTGALGFPQLGWIGLAIGTSVGHIVGALILVTVLVRGRAGMQWRLSELTWDGPLTRHMLKIGIPGGMDVLAVLGCHLTYVSIINTLGTDSAAAHGLGVELEALAYAPASSFAVAAATMTGQLLGANQLSRARRMVLWAILVGVVFMSTMGALFHQYGGSLANVFVGESSPRTAALTTDYLKIVSFSMPFLAITMVLTGVLRGAGDTLCSLAVTFTGLALIRVPGAAWLAWSEFTVPGTTWTIDGWDWGVHGAWWAMVFDVSLRSSLLLIRFVTGGWTKQR